MKEKVHTGYAAKRNAPQPGMSTWQLTKIFLLVLLYYPMSVGLTFYQKWFIKSYKFPLLVVSCHYVIKFIGAALLRRGHRLVKGRDRRVSLLSVVLLISAGLFLFTYQSQQFDLTGFMLVEFAALCGGVRWALSQFVMQRDEIGLHNPIDMMYHVQPWMITCIIPLVLIFESSGVDSIWSDNVLMYDHGYAPLHIFNLIFCGGLIAFCMELAEYLLLVNTSGLTLNIFGILKEIITLALAHQYNGDRFSPVNIIGLLLCISGILLHVVLKALARSNEAETEVKEMMATKTLLTAGLEPNDSDGDR
uniref:Sugar phosphate transporter domain-containing protein n=1 Tax=Plectus sambesii TaxID=2011161 RepID=A0A914UMJ9_9BILA